MKRMLFICMLLTVMNGIAQNTSCYRNEELPSDEYNWIVSPVSIPDSIHFCSLREALLAAENIQHTLPKGTFTERHPLTIRIAPSVYWIDNPDDPNEKKPLPGENIPYGLKIKVSHLRLVGLGENPEQTVIASNRGQTQGAIGNFTMLHLTGEDITFENLTLGNYCNVDLIYPRDSTLNRKRRADAIVQAQLAICQGDRIAAHNCRFISRLNLCPLVGAKRTFFENCYFECTDDALCGTGIYHNCRFTFFSGKPFYSTQGTGAIFLDCDFYSRTNGRQYLVKVGSPVTMVDCRWQSQQADLTIGWTPNPTDDLRSYQYGLTLNKKPLFIDHCSQHLTVDMTGKELIEAYRLTLPKHLFNPEETGDTIVYNLLNLTDNGDGWNPACQSKEILKRYSQKAVALTLNHRTATIESGIDTIHLKASASKFMQEPDFSQTWKKIFWHVNGKNPSCIQTQNLPDGSLLIMGKNMTEETEEVQVVATTPTGLEAACVIHVYPRQLPPPSILQNPSLIQIGDSLTFCYELDLKGRKDHSSITWMRSLTPDGKAAIPVAVSPQYSPKQNYLLTTADNGYYILATLTPKHQRSPYGKATTIGTETPISIRNKRQASFDTDFSDFPPMKQSKILAGFWTVDTYKPIDTKAYEWHTDTTTTPWTYGYGVDGAAHARGLIQHARGARLLYTPQPHEYGDMEITLYADPCKTAGQGFGSATGQYMDVYIKFDTHTLSGYALRIIRTTKHDKAVDFLLMKYINGEAIPISQAVSSICYRTGCIIRLKAEGEKLTAYVHNIHPLPEPHKADLKKEVVLSASITPSPHGGTGIQHTGSTGASATVLKRMSINWE